jgi:hypothetical protein
MRKLIISTIGISILAMAVSVQAETVTIPEKVKEEVLKRHPKAHDLEASHEKHFGQEFLEVSFKDENKEQYFELFTQKGHLFANELLIENLGEASPAVIETLKQHFPKYELKKAELITNPNGAGEEYEIHVVADGENWKISIDNKGVVGFKERY